jgi:molybdopterin molybdotransferase
VLSIAEARARILAAVPRLPAEEVDLAQAQDRILAGAVRAVRPLPAWDNSAMDGFAVRAAELPGELPVAGVIAAGDPPGRVLAPGSSLRIMTGAPVPVGADAVVMRENAQDLGERVRFADGVRVGRDIRRAGEDVAAGDPILDAGARLGAGEIGLLAAQGLARVAVARRPRVAILSTGDELVPLGREPGPGQIVSSNAWALAAQVREAGGEPVDCGIASDDRDALVARLHAALAGADALVSSGGVSVGDFDHVKEAFAAAGVAIDFWKVAMKPGKPLAFGAAAGTPVFGLPGNPVSSMIGFELFVRPALLAMQGAARTGRVEVRVRLAAAYRKEPGRAHVLRARLERDGAELVAHLHPRQGSAMMSSMVGLDALVLVDADAGDQPAGARLPALLVRA